jgi:hypothetical protein
VIEITTAMAARLLLAVRLPRLLVRRTNASKRAWATPKRHKIAGRSKGIAGTIKIMFSISKGFARADEAFRN